MSQPFYLATCLPPGDVTHDDNRQVIINENQVATIEPGKDDTAIVKMSNGDVWVTIDPSYESWVADVIVRKY